MIQAPTYAFHIEHVPGEPGIVRFLGLIIGETSEEIATTVRIMLRHDEVAIAYPHTGWVPGESFEIWPEQEMVV